MVRQRRSFSTEFKREAAGLGLDQGYSAAQAARAFDIARLSYCENRHQRPRIDVERLALRAIVAELLNQSRRSAGSRTIMIQMRESGLDVGRLKTQRLMQEAGLVCQQPRPPAYRRTVVERPDIPNRLNRQFTVDAPNRVWCGDITYIWVQNRWHYLAVVLDLYARRVVGWALTDCPDAALSVKALDRAFEQRGRPPGLLSHFDQGGQYASRASRQQLWRYRIQQSMSRRGNSWDNAPMERLFRSYKSEWMPSTGYLSAQEALRDISFYLTERYNRQRRRVARPSGRNTQFTVQN